MSGQKKKKSRRLLDCDNCKTQADCCKLGAWIDLDEAKKISERGIKGEFFHLEKDTSSPSGWRIGTSYEDEKCTFLDPDGLCRVHKTDYNLKPKTCIEFPYENNKISYIAGSLCTLYKKKWAAKRKG